VNDISVILLVNATVKRPVLTELDKEYNNDWQWLKQQEYGAELATRRFKRLPQLSTKTLHRFLTERNN
jgi:hypothetical protein